MRRVLFSILVTASPISVATRSAVVAIPPLMRSAAATAFPAASSILSAWSATVPAESLRALTGVPALRGRRIEVRSSFAGDAAVGVSTCALSRTRALASRLSGRLATAFRAQGRAPSHRVHAIERRECPTAIGSRSDSIK